MWCPRCQTIANTRGEDKQDSNVPDAIYTIYHCPKCGRLLAMTKVDGQGKVTASSPLTIT